MNLTTQTHLVPKLRISGDIHVVPAYAFIPGIGAILPFYFHNQTYRSSLIYINSVTIGIKMAVMVF
jgi:hypothetical protein